jgi:hypothetical protein
MQNPFLSLWLPVPRAKWVQSLFRDNDRESRPLYEEWMKDVTLHIPSFSRAPQR